MKRPVVVCVVGKKKSGKTTTVVGLVAELTRRGHDVMTVKHGHGFDLDRSGSDSWRHRHQGGASRVLVSGPDEFALMGRWGPRRGAGSAGEGEAPGTGRAAEEAREPSLDDLVDAHLADADVVIVEGFKASAHPRIEVYRKAAHPAALYDADAGQSYLAVLTDDPEFEAGCPVGDVHDPARFVWLASLVEDLMRASPESAGPSGPHREHTIRLP